MQRATKLRTRPLADEQTLARRRRRERLAKLMEGWAGEDTRLIERTCPHPTQHDFSDPAHVSSAKSQPNRNQVHQLRKVAADLAALGEWEALEQLEVGVVRMFAQVRETVPEAPDPLGPSIASALAELRDVEGEAVEAMADGVVDPEERKRIAQEADEGLAALRRLRRRIHRRLEESEPLSPRVELSE